MIRNTTPYLALCSDCHSHGHIVFADGSKSPEFIDFQIGLSLLFDGYQKRLLTYEEMKMVSGQIMNAKFIDLEELRKELREVLKSEKELLEALKNKDIPKFGGCILN